MRNILALCLALLLLPVCAQAGPMAEVPLVAVNLLQFQGLVVDRGGKLEDWQPAFQAAIAQALKEGRPLQVPAGRFVIRRAIVVPPPSGPDRHPWGPVDLKMVGAGRELTIIEQKDPRQDVLVWRGKSLKVHRYRGYLGHICLEGGRIGLNLDHHSYFTMEHCYLHGMETGIVCGGWSNRFTNLAIRWCRKDGFRGRGHFNNNVLRDMYFSRDNVGFYLEGGYGNRIEASAFEVCRLAVFLRGAISFSLVDSYFEGNGYSDNPFQRFIGEPPTFGTVHVDYASRAVLVSGNILRMNLTPQEPLLSLSGCLDCTVQANLFRKSARGIRLRRGCLTGEAACLVRGLRLEGNSFDAVGEEVSAEAAGLLEGALEPVPRAVPGRPPAAEPTGRPTPSKSAPGKSAPAVDLPR